MRPDAAFIAQPIRSLQTMLQVLALDDPSLPLIVPDGIYDSSTVNAVAAFQRKNGLPATGSTDQITWDAIEAAFENANIRVSKADPIELLLEPGQVIRENETGPYVDLLQSMLIFLSSQHATISEPVHTGVLDGPTQASIRDLQRLSGLEQTGLADRITYKNLVHQFTLGAHHYYRKERNEQ